ncbi:hypothetical protein MKEN_00551900 [Mycena kentingensis (nom. inval.)]|nr:hypothetical protein MKEN_00551900 [Mycena kentingensis (nom. inval.)]
MTTLPLSPQPQNLPPRAQTNPPSRRGSQNSHAASTLGPKPRRGGKDKNPGDLYFKTDAEAWLEDDEKLIEACKAHWSSPAYEHMAISIDPPLATRKTTSASIMTLPKRDSKVI